jgi:hypothetical protein
MAGGVSAGRYAYTNPAPAPARRITCITTIRRIRDELQVRAPRRQDSASALFSRSQRWRGRSADHPRQSSSLSDLASDNGARSASGRSSPAGWGRQATRLASTVRTVRAREPSAPVTGPREKEGMMVKLVPILHSSAVDPGSHPARVNQRGGNRWPAARSGHGFRQASYVTWRPYPPGSRRRVRVRCRGDLL